MEEVEEEVVKKEKVWKREINGQYSIDSANRLQVFVVYMGHLMGWSADILKKWCHLINTKMKVDLLTKQSAYSTSK